MFATTTPTIPPEILLRPARQVGREEEAAGAFARARDALHAGLGALGLRPGDGVLLPAYVCGSILTPLQSRGLKAIFYGLEEDLTPAAGDLERRWPDARALYLIDYFGLCRPPASVVEEGRRRGVSIIRDLAHRMYGDAPSEAAEGDLSIWSLWKFYPVPDGGILRLGGAGRPAPPAPASPAAGAAIRGGKLVLKNLATRVGMGGRGRTVPAGKGGRGDLSSPAWRLTGRRMSPVSRFLLSRSDPGSMAARRRLNASRLARRLAGLGRRARCLFGAIPEGAVPYAFPLLVEDRDDLLRALRKAGIHAEATFRDAPFRLEGSVEARPGVLEEAASLADRMIALPVTSDLGEREMDSIASAVEAWCR